MAKLKEQLEQIFDEQNKLKADVAKAYFEYVQKTELVSLRKQKLIVGEIDKFIDLYYIREENARCDLYKFCILFTKYVECDIHDLSEILESIGYIIYEHKAVGNLSWCKPYIKGIKPK